jgi:hypothetical protein
MAVKGDRRESRSERSPFTATAAKDTARERGKASQATILYFQQVTAQ